MAKSIGACLRPLVLCSVVLAACGGGNDDATETTGAVRGSVGFGAPAAVATVSAEASGATCPLGGARIDAGIDRNGDGRVGGNEIASTQFVCHGQAGAAGATGATGTAGAAGVNSLVRLSAVAPGAACAGGGTRVDVGADANRNGVLDAGEISSNDHVCDGTNGTNGTDGRSSLVIVAAEPAGANCVHGGSRVAAGLDGNADGVLQTAEVTSTTYLCNPPPAGLTWVTVTASAVQAQPNTGYLAAATTAVVVTLPASPALGDIVRVSGTGSGGWAIAQNAGQSIVLGRSGLVAHGPAASHFGVALTADGATGVATVGGGAQMQRTTDFGATWTPIGPTGDWIAVAMSADGARLVAGTANGDVWSSLDGGQSWTPAGLFGTWYGVTVSRDGSRFAAVNFLDGYIYTSTDGTTWTQRDAPRQWTSISASADGTRLAATAYGSNGSGSEWIYVSTDAGATWSPRATLGVWRSVAHSADGLRLVAGEYNGRLAVSSDGGLTWAARESVRGWHYVASSADGRVLTASVYNGRLYRSVDFGLTWTPLGNTALWAGLATSADGSIFASAPLGSAPIHVFGVPVRTTTGTTGALFGAQHDAVELQAAGGGTWLAVSSSGSLVPR